jgi:hypothetical protein
VRGEALPEREALLVKKHKTSCGHCGQAQDPLCGATVQVDCDKVIDIGLDFMF